MNQAKLHYLYDPLCGWCYGASPLILAANESIAIEMHAGGMMSGAQRRAVTPELRQFVVAHDERIAKLSGQHFGEAYIKGLLNDTGAVLDSTPPITAVLAAEQIAHRGHDMLRRMQTAHYVDGLRIADAAVLLELAIDIGLDATHFQQAFEDLTGPATRAHIDDSRAMMVKVGAQGFPTLVLEQDGIFTLLDITSCLGKPDAWRALLAKHKKERLQKRVSLLEPVVSGGAGGI